MGDYEDIPADEINGLPLVPDICILYNGKDHFSF